MIIDTPAVVPPSAPINRPLSNERLGGGTTSVPTESPRPLDDPEEGDASRRNEEQANTEERPGRNDAELAARTRVDTAREQASDSRSPEPTPRQTDEPVGAEDTFLSREEIEHLRERLEARLATRNPAGATLRSVDENI